MNILFIYPKYPDTFWSFSNVLKFVRKKAAFPPLGLLTISSMLPKEWSKKLVDINVNELKNEDINWADMIFISGMIVQKDSIRDIIKKCNGKKIVGGGPVFTTGHEKFEGVDHFILNEAEITLPLFLKDLEEGKLKKIYTSEEKPDVTKTPIPDWNLIDFKDYSTMAIQYSRGCPFNCEFCDIIIMNGRVPRTKTPEQLMNELDSLKDAGYKGSIFIVDDNFIGNKKNVKEMLRRLIKWQKKNKHNFKFLTEASVNLADDEELLSLMSVANFDKVFLGFETPSNESLKECKKLQNVNKDLVAGVRKINQYGMQVMGGFIVGFDNDGEDIFDIQIKFIQEIGVVTAMVGVLTALPQTRLWYRLKAEERLLKDSTGGNTDGDLNFIPKMNKKKLMDGYSRLVNTIYSRKNYYERIDTFLKNYTPTSKSKASMDEFHAFISSLWRIGIISKARFYYWRLILKTSIFKIRSLPTAIELAIIGMHFEKVSRKI
ncbi:MAG: B12-binding domain-containing radical SAM protein [Nanoarchaeota archaeon]|nr:B12-binding domain-containing radical SAM protein [Nanoarchaeota archaeon]|tara:strand:- start:235 stop:1698 length:1464 start_codon:yes stop_codon:yes gene_type:complete